MVEGDLFLILSALHFLVPYVEDLLLFFSMTFFFFCAR